MIEPKDHDATTSSAEGALQGAAAAPATGDRPGAEPLPRPLPDDALIILPVRNTVMFPGVVLPLTVGRERSLAAVQEAVRLERPLGGP